MKITVLQHEAGEHAGFFEIIWREQEIYPRVLRLYETQEIPLLHETHLLILGGSMSVHDEREFPFLRQEKCLIRECIKRHLPVLGICLGAQLIADALGGRVFPYRKELGWTPLAGLEYAHPPLFPLQFHAFQLHRDTFEVPAGGTLLCTGEMVKNQAFAIGSAWGLQFHLEMTEPLIEDWIRDCNREEKERIRADTAHFLLSSNNLCRMVGERFLRRPAESNS
jgi:GMP synthase (glutamine-hydrolysing)